jgi:transposase
MGLDPCREDTCLKPKPKRKENESCFTPESTSQRNPVAISFSTKKSQKVKSFSLDNTHEAFQNLLERLKALSIPKENLLIGLEALGGFWENLYSHLKENGLSIILLNPYHTNKSREALAKKAKTNDIDALVIAQLLRTSEYVQSQVAPACCRQVRNHSIPHGDHQTPLRTDQRT